MTQLNMEFSNEKKKKKIKFMKRYVNVCFVILPLKILLGLKYQALYYVSFFETSHSKT